MLMKRDLWETEEPRSRKANFLPLHFNPYMGYDVGNKVQDFFTST